jgi:hypothetical protein
MLFQKVVSKIINHFLVNKYNTFMKAWKHLLPLPQIYSKKQEWVKAISKQLG